MQKEQVAILARVTGKVQGVYFRGWTKNEAERLGLAGWVRNEHDGSVTALIAGPKTDAEKMVSLLWRGPPAARVEAVSTEPADPPGWPVRFEILR